MSKNPQTAAEFMALAVGPDSARDVYPGIFPVANNDIMAIQDKATGVKWYLGMYRDGERFRGIAAPPQV